MDLDNISPRNWLRTMASTAVGAFTAYESAPLIDDEFNQACAKVIAPANEAQRKKEEERLANESSWITALSQVPASLAIDQIASTITGETKEFDPESSDLLKTIFYMFAGLPVTLQLAPWLKNRRKINQTVAKVAGLKPAKVEALKKQLIERSTLTSNIWASIPSALISFIWLIRDMGSAHERRSLQRSSTESSGPSWEPIE